MKLVNTKVLEICLLDVGWSFQVNCEIPRNIVTLTTTKTVDSIKKFRDFMTVS